MWTLSPSLAHLRMKESSSSAHFTPLSSDKLKTQFHFICGWSENKPLCIPNETIGHLPLIPSERFPGTDTGLPLWGLKILTTIGRQLSLLVPSFSLVFSSNQKTCSFFPPQSGAWTSKPCPNATVPATFGPVHPFLTTAYSCRVIRATP